MKFASSNVSSLYNVAIEAIKGQQTISELSKQFELTPKQICDWKKEFLSKAATVFTKESPDLSKDRQIHELHAKIGEMDVMIDFLKKKVVTRFTSVEDRRHLVEAGCPNLSIFQQCMLLNMSRSSFYYKPVCENEFNLEIMRIVDEIYLESPFYGSRRMVVELGRRGYDVGRKLVRRLMRLMGIEALYPHPKTTVSAPEHKKYPYLLRNLKVDHRNQVWEMDITYVPMRHGFMYLAAVIDVYSRRIMGWGLSNTMEAEWCAEIAAEAFERHGRPEIFNTDQGSQFTSDVFIETLVGSNPTEPKIRVSMDGRGRATDDIYIEWFWRNIKYENIYLNAYETGMDLYRGIEGYIQFYNTQRPHQSLENLTPEKFFMGVA